MRRMSMTLTMAVALGTLAFPAAASAAVRAPVDAAASVSTVCPDVAHYENAARDGQNCSTVPPGAGQMWSTTLNAPASYPVIAGGRVFVTTSSPGGAYGGDLYALNAQTGAIEWGPIALSGTYYYFPLAFDKGRVFVNNFDGTVTAFNAATGAQEWSTPTNNFSGEPVATKGTVWIDGSAGVYGLSETTGAIAAQSGYLDGNGADPGVNGSGVYLSAGCSQFKLSLSAQVVWRDNSGCSGGGGASTALWRGRMYGSEGHQILAQSTGALEGSFSGVPAFSGTTGFFASGDAVSALNVANGNASLWTANLPATVVAGPVATPSAVWVGTSASTLVALSPATGEVLSTITLPGLPGGGAEYSGDPSDIGIGNNVLVVPTGSTVTAFG
jgi:outer membrane protein assembly factor BamB